MPSGLPSAGRSIAGSVSFIAWFAAAGIIGLLLVSYSLPQDLSRRSEPYATLVCISFFGRVLTFQFGLMLCALAVLAVILRRKRLLLVSAVMAGICLVPTAKTLLPHDLPPAAEPALRVMSMNLKYTFTHGELIWGQIQKYKPDVLALEDYTPYDQSVIEESVGQDYPSRQFYLNFMQGLAIYSRFPFASEPRISFTATHRQIRVAVLFHGQPIVIYVEHPFSPRSKQRILNNRMSTLDLAGQVRAEKLPVIAVGDFNFTETTPNESVLKVVGLEDAFELAGHGRGSTWPMDPAWEQWLPGVRIDHIFCSRQLTCTEFMIGQPDGSDHLPIIADIAIRR